MFKRKYLMLCGLSVLITAAAVNASSAVNRIDLYVFQTMAKQANTIRVPGVPVHVHVLDSVHQAESAITQQLFVQIQGQVSPAQLQKYLNSDQGQQSLQAIRAAWQLPFNAYNQGIRKVPAVVVNHQYVVYGTLNIRQALHDISAAMRSGQQ